MSKHLKKRKVRLTRVVETLSPATGQVVREFQAKFVTVYGLTRKQLREERKRKQWMYERRMR